MIFDESCGVLYGVRDLPVEFWSSSYGTVSGVRQSISPSSSIFPILNFSKLLLRKAAFELIRCSGIETFGGEEDIDWASWHAGSMLREQ